MMAALVACFSACSSEEETPVAEDATFTVDTTVSYYEGLTLQIGFPDSTEPLASAVVDENGLAVFAVDMTSYAGQSVWFCVPKVAKFFHALTPEECANGMLALPDKDKGSTLQTEGADVQVGGKYYKNDWMVALYMGVNKDGNPDGVPIYWATGNLIATKINAANSGSTEAVFHIATFEESCEEANANSTAYLGADERLLEESSDAYDAIDAGAQWDLFSFGDASGVMMYFHELDEFVEKSLQADGSTVLYDLSGNPDCDIATAQLGGSWRTPTGGYSGYNVQNEFAAFEDNSDIRLDVVGSDGCTSDSDLLLGSEGTCDADAKILVLQLLHDRYHRGTSHPVVKCLAEYPVMPVIIESCHVRHDRSGDAYPVIIDYLIPACRPDIDNERRDLKRSLLLSLCHEVWRL